MYEYATGRGGLTRFFALRADCYIAAKMEARQRKIAKLRKIADSEKRERKKNANLFSQYLSISNC